MKAQKGFTLIELLIVITLIGILAAIGNHNYKDYVRRAEMSGVLAGTSNCRTEITVMILSGRATTAKLEQASCEISQKTKYVKSVTVNGSGVITIDLNHSPGGGIVGGQVTINPMRIGFAQIQDTVNINGTQTIARWVCDGSKDYINSLLPATCRL
jgi:prepilin-type N-terminal cleavage/methylation domain-containing protein